THLLQVADAEIHVAVAVGLDVLEGNAEGGIHRVAEIPAQRGAATGGGDVVDVLFRDAREGAALALRRDVVDVAGVLRREGNEAQRRTIGRNRNVHHRAHVVAGAAVLRRVELGFGPGIEAGRVGL